MLEEGSLLKPMLQKELIHRITNCFFGEHSEDFNNNVPCSDKLRDRLQEYAAMNQTQIENIPIPGAKTDLSKATAAARETRKSVDYQYMEFLNKLKHAQEQHKHGEF